MPRVYPYLSVYMKRLFITTVVLLFLGTILGPTAGAQSAVPDKFPASGGASVVFDGSVWKKIDSPMKTDGVLSIQQPDGSVYVRQFSGPVEVKWFGARGDGVTDDTRAIQNAINTGNSVHFARGVYRVGELQMASRQAPVTYTGDGDTPFGGSSGTVLIARDFGQRSVLNIGSPSVTVQHMTVNGNLKARFGILNIYGADFRLISCSITKTLEYGACIVQGAARILHSNFSANKGVGLFLFNDSVVEGGGFSQGTIPLSIGQGGNRISGINAYQGSQCNILIQYNTAVDTLKWAKVRRIGNTHMTNIYADNPVNAKSVPVIRIAGSQTDLVTDTQISNLYIGTAQEGPQGEFQDGLDFSRKAAGGIDISFAARTAISNSTFLGNGGAATQGRYTDYWIRASETSGLVVSGTLMQGSNKNAVQLTGTNTDVTFSGVQFIGWGDKLGKGEDKAAIFQRGVIGSLLVAGCSFFVYSDTTCYAVSMEDVNRLMLSGSIIRYPGTRIALSNKNAYSGTFERSGSNVTQLFPNARSNDNQAARKSADEIRRTIGYQSDKWITLFQSDDIFSNLKGTVLLELRFSTVPAGGKLSEVIGSGILPFPGSSPEGNQLLPVNLNMNAQVTGSRSVKFRWLLSPTGKPLFQMYVSGDGSVSGNIDVAARVARFF